MRVARWAALCPSELFIAGLPWSVRWLYSRVSGFVAGPLIGSWAESLTVGGRPVVAVGKKMRIVLSVLVGEVMIAEVARREKVSEQLIGRWKVDFLEAGKTGLAVGKSGLSTREQQLEAEVVWSEWLFSDFG